jgi:hypothetical protein
MLLFSSAVAVCTNNNKYALKMKEIIFMFVKNEYIFNWLFIYSLAVCRNNLKLFYVHIIELLGFDKKKKLD